MTWFCQHPFIFGLTIVSVVALVFSGIADIIYDGDNTVGTVMFLVCIWFCTGFGYLMTLIR